MGSVSLKIGDGTARFRRGTLCSSALHLVMLTSVLATNIFALYAFTSAPPFHHPLAREAHKNLSLISEHVSLILGEIESSERRLHQIQRDLAGFDSLDPSRPGIPIELKLFLSPHPLPLGRDSRSGITHMQSSVPHSCARSTHLPLLSKLMSYKPFSKCPPLEPPNLLMLLLSKGCDPLPRRRCLSTPNPSPKPLLLSSLWIRSRGKNDFLIDEVLALGKGHIRIGFDVTSGAGDFAALMAERNVTIVTSTIESGDVVAARGLFPLQLTAMSRFPFHDSIFDLVHTTKGLDEGSMDKTRPEGLEFLMFDIDRVLRAGGLLWLDNYRCVDEERKRTVTRLIERFGYKKLKWVVGDRTDKEGNPLVYLSAVLQKPARG